MKKTLVLILAVAALLLTQSAYALGGAILGPSTVHKAKNSIVTITDILALYTAVDDQVIVQSDNFTGKGNIPGVYDIVLTLANSNTTKVAVVNVVDDLGQATLVTNQNNIYIANNKILSASEIVDILTKTGYVSYNSTAAVSLLANTYTGNEKNNGSYAVDFRIVTSSGTNTLYAAVIHVHQPDNLVIGDFIITAPPTFADRIIMLIKNVVPLVIIVVIGMAIYLGFKKYKRVVGGKK